MSLSSKNPAVFAGLLGAGGWARPALAATSLAVLPELDLGSPYAQFALGCVAGAAVSGAVVLTAQLAMDINDERAEAMSYRQAELIPFVPAAEIEELDASDSEVGEAEVDARSIVAPAGKHWAKASTEGAASDTDDDASTPKGRRFSAVTPVDEEASAPKGRRFAKSEEVDEAAHASASRPRHMAVENTPATPAVATSEAEEEPLRVSVPETVEQEGATTNLKTAKSEVRTRAARIPRVEQVGEAAPKTEQPSVPAPKEEESDLANVAETYVKRRTLRERMAARAAGVSSVLANRIGIDMFDDLPVIERADGTVGDVGTGWWDNALGSSIRRVSDIDSGIIDSVSASTSPLEPVQLVTAAAPVRPKDGAYRAAYISRNVAEIDVGIYPEKRTVEDVDQKEDLWETALRAMGDRIDQNGAPVFAEVISIAEPVDESDEPTGFIPFKMPAGHPEVVDRSTYVDYLIDEEFSQNPSPVARKSSRDFLTVIKGGSQKSRPLSAQAARKAHAPRHMASTQRIPLAREA